MIRRISINGEFRGIVRASDRVEVHKEGRVYGEIYTPCLIIEAGAIFEGKCNMSEKALVDKEKAGSPQVKAPQAPQGPMKPVVEERTKTL